jgi:hypothetical protein
VKNVLNLLEAGLALALASLLALGGALVAGCGDSTLSAQEYKARWAGIMDPFETRIEKDDRKANELLAKNDLGAVTALLNRRIAGVDETLDMVARLRPPPELRDLHAITLYELFAVKQQLQTQNNLNDAIRKDEPTTDLVTIADNAKARTMKVTRELILELEKHGIKLKVMEKPSGQQQGSAPASTAPSSAPR